MSAGGKQACTTVKLLILQYWVQDGTQVNQLFNGFGTTIVSSELIDGVRAGIYPEGPTEAATSSQEFSKGAMAGITLAAVVGSVIILLAVWAVMLLCCGGRPQGSREIALVSAAGAGRLLQDHRRQVVNNRAPAHRVPPQYHGRHQLRTVAGAPGSKQQDLHPAVAQHTVVYVYT